jgi:protoheme IX farnesyltransferase
LQVARRIVGYTWLTVATSLLLWPLATSWVYGAVAVVAGAWFLAAAHGLLARVKRGAPTRTLPLFHLSNTYLAVLFVGVAVDALVR